MRVPVSSFSACSHAAARSWAPRLGSVGEKKVWANISSLVFRLGVIGV